MNKTCLMCLVSIFCSALLFAQTVQIEWPEQVYSCFGGDTIRLSCTVTDTSNSENDVVLKWLLDGAGLAHTGNSVVFEVPDGVHSLEAVLESPGGHVLGRDLLEIDAHPYDSIDIVCTGLYNWHYAAYSINGDLVYDARRSGLDGGTIRYFVDGDDIYTAYNHGYTSSYCKNGVKISPDWSPECNISSLTIHDQKVFAVGHYRDSATRAGRACAMVDSAVIPLKTDFNVNSNAAYIGVFNDDWWVVGVADGGQALVVWKNGEEYIRVNDTGYGATAKLFAGPCGFYADSSNLIMGGNYLINPEGQDYGLTVGFIYKNGERRFLMLDSTRTDPAIGNNELFAAKMYSFYADDSVTYAVAGGTGYDEFQGPFLFRNFTPMPWIDTTVPLAGISAVTKYRGHLFAAGSYIINNKQVNCYWRNGKRFDLAPADSSLTTIQRIIVRDKLPPTGVYGSTHLPDHARKAHRVALSTAIKNNHIELKLTIPSPGAFKVQMLDAAGRMVRTVSLGNLSTGEHSASLKTNRLTPGVYVIRVFDSGNKMAAAATVCLSGK